MTFEEYWKAINEDQVRPDEPVGDSWTEEEAKAIAKHRWDNEIHPLTRLDSTDLEKILNKSVPRGTFN